jgi:hypothetical protein
VRRQSRNGFSRPILFQEVKFMSIKTIAAALALGAVCAVAPSLASAGGEIQEYERTSVNSYAGGGYGAYAPPMPANYARPMGAYYGGYGCSACATMPYGYSYGAPAGGGFGNDIFTAGLLGVGIGYLLFH